MSRATRATWFTPRYCIRSLAMAASVALRRIFRRAPAQRKENRVFYFLARRSSAANIDRVASIPEAVVPIGAEMITDWAGTSRRDDDHTCGWRYDDGTADDHDRTVIAIAPAADAAVPADAATTAGFCRRSDCESRDDNQSDIVDFHLSSPRKMCRRNLPAPNDKPHSRAAEGPTSALSGSLGRSRWPTGRST